MDGSPNSHAITFRKRLKYLYKKIDSVSSLLWSHDNHITGRRLRSEIEKEDIQLKWKNNETTQTGYGEIAMGSMTNLFNLMQNASKLIKTYCTKDKQFKELLLYEPEEYDMNSESLFLDIGSGFGKPVFHSAFQVGCESHGVEVVPARVEFCLDFYFEYIHEKNFFGKVDAKIQAKDTCTVQAQKEAENIHQCSNTSTQHNSSSSKISNGNSKIYTEEHGLFFESEGEGSFGNKINLNKISSTYYDEIILDSSNNSYLELRLDRDLFKANDFIEYLVSTQKNHSSILVDDGLSPALTYSNHFFFDELVVESTQNCECDMVHLADTLTKIIYKINQHDTPSLIYNILPTVSDNFSLLKMIWYVNVIFGGTAVLKEAPATLPYHFIPPNRYAIRHRLESQREFLTCKAINIYEELKNALETREKEKVDLEVLKGKYYDGNDVILKEVLCNFKFIQFKDNWHQLTSFIAEDATKYKCYANSKKEHFTHIYSYNKLMSKECRKKIAKILNSTHFKILAWYSNLKQTKNAGLKNFAFLAKFPMQSTSTEKFNVYVYIKTK